MATAANEPKREMDRMRANEAREENNADGSGVSKIVEILFPNAPFI